MYSLAVQRLAVLENLCLTVRKRENQNALSVNLIFFLLHMLKNSKAKWSTTMTTDQTIKEKIILRVVSKFKFLHVVPRFFGEVVDAYYLEVDNDDGEITEDDDEDVKEEDE
uniref:Uncharacterized protein n=1 Tax=Brassica oleracea var. oleracea TaxID=109376 RepID=A0A0D3E5I7_BRAOL